MADEVTDGLSASQLFQPGRGLGYSDFLVLPGLNKSFGKKPSMWGQLTRRIKLHTSLVSAPLDFVTDSKMAIAMALAGGVGIIHMNSSPEAQAQEVQKVKECPIPSNDQLASKDSNGKLLVGAAIGTSEENKARLQLLVGAGVNFVMFDTRRGDSEVQVNMIRFIKSTYPSVDVIGGSVVTKAAAKRLITAGVDGLWVGGRDETVFTNTVSLGRQMANAVYEVAVAAQDANVPVVAESCSEHIFKVFALGADIVMMGSFLAGVSEAPGEQQGQKKKKAAKPAGGSVAHEGPLHELIEHIIAEVQQNTANAGAMDLDDLRRMLYSGDLRFEQHMHTDLF